jgi:hypothetical protein
LKSINKYSATIYLGENEGNINISDCTFTNISNNYNFVEAGAIYIGMSFFVRHNYCIVSNNSFYDIFTNASVVELYSLFYSLLFKYNSFYNVSSTNYGGVFFFFCFIY